MNFATVFNAAVKSLPISVATTIFAATASAIFSASLLFGDNWTWLAAVFLWAESTCASIIYMLLIHREKLDSRIDQIGNLIRFDSLTGALTRGHFLDKVRRNRDDGCLMIADVDHFKDINDNYGHDVGDRALVLMTKMLQEEIGDLGMVGRLGGEEFGIYLPTVSADEAKVIGEGLVATAQMRGAEDDEPWLYPSISVGITMRNEREPIGHTLKRADRALYEAKKNGRRRVEFHCAEPHLVEFETIANS